MIFVEKNESRTCMGRRGLTLVEIVVVVAIFGLLGAILLESLSNARKQAWRIECASNLRGVGNAFNVYATDAGRYPYIGSKNPNWDARVDPFDEISLRRESFDYFGVVLPPLLIRHSLGDPRAFYCPTSLRKDEVARGPYLRSGSGQIIEAWRNGNFSYITLFSVMYSFPGDDGQSTFDPLRESPHRNFYGMPVNLRNPRAVLAGDRVVERPPRPKLPGSNHGREGGWFYFTTGDVQWHPWKTLTAHTTPKKHTWYWPSAVKRTPVETSVTSALP